MNLKFIFKNNIMIASLIIILILSIDIKGYTAYPSNKNFTIAVAFSTLNIPFFVDMEKGIRSEAKRIGVKLIVTDAQDNAAKQLSQVEDLLTQKPDLLLLNPIDPDMLVSAVDAAVNAKVPVIAIDRIVNSDKIISFIGVDDVEGGKIAGKYIVEKLKGKGNLVILEGVSGSSPQRDRATGFEEIINKYPDIRILAKQTANFNRNEGMSVMENLLQAHRKIDAVFAHNDEMALGALEAIRAAKREKEMIVVGFDAQEEAKKAIKEGRMSATIEGSPYKLGILGIQTAIKYLNGELVAAKVILPLELITKETLAE